MLASCYLPSFMPALKLLVIANPTAGYLHLLEQIGEPVDIQVGNDLEFLKAHAPNADVLLNAGPEGDLLQAVFPFAKKVQWVHTLSAGVDKVLFPGLNESPVPLTNGRGAFKDGLAEFALASMLFFAKDLRRLVRNQEASRWEQFDVVFLRGQTLGIVGYGEIGRESARLARALGMKVVATSRRSANMDDAQIYPLEQLRDMLAVCDYVLIATPLTPETKGMIGEAELRAMKNSAVIINVGRGPVIVEAALVAVLEQRRIRGAALDVFDKEPLPEGHPFYRLDNVLLSPHSADHTVGWEELAMRIFIANFERFRKGQPLTNVVDKNAGY
jgi:phosphoglycerate dehydrogenase-like enzyme